MNAVQNFYPPNRVAIALKKATPCTVGECIRQADENLRHIAQACLDHVDSNLEKMEAALQSWPAAEDRDYLLALYNLSLRLVGVASVGGLKDLDLTAKSLCDVVDGLLARSAWEREPISVHVSAMRLLRHPEALGGGVSVVVDGLMRVRQRYAMPPPGPRPKAEPRKV